MASSPHQVKFQTRRRQAERHCSLGRAPSRSQPSFGPPELAGAIPLTSVSLGVPLGEMESLTPRAGL